MILSSGALWSSGATAMRQWDRSHCDKGIIGSRSFAMNQILWNRFQSIIEKTSPDLETKSFQVILNGNSHFLFQLWMLLPKFPCIGNHSNFHILREACLNFDISRGISKLLYISPGISKFPYIAGGISWLQYIEGGVSKFDPYTDGIICEFPYIEEDISKKTMHWERHIFIFIHQRKPKCMIKKLNI